MLPPFVMGGGWFSSTLSVNIKSKKGAVPHPLLFTLEYLNKL